MPLMMFKDLLEGVWFESEKKNAVKKETDEENLLAQVDEETFQIMMVMAFDEESKPLVSFLLSAPSLLNPTPNHPICKGFVFLIKRLPNQDCRMINWRLISHIALT
ncbi:hypothetical protein O181_024758 [Austropuccinia psidii MF-1]|uniref:Uncharacterized protein n=1 Tax=Austropuccinia psidii MF-1 TaxID=1389203 RepID=A0A9Q3CJH3_9BASI|nr:hypothetical protein [Austropuccinia psidii MF-1]